MYICTPGTMSRHSGAETKKKIATPYVKEHSSHQLTITIEEL